MFIKNWSYTKQKFKNLWVIRDLLQESKKTLKKRGKKEKGNVDYNFILIYYDNSAKMGMQLLHKSASLSDLTALKLDFLAEKAKFQLDITISDTQRHNYSEKSVYRIGTHKPMGGYSNVGFNCTAESKALTFHISFIVEVRHFPTILLIIIIVSIC